MTLLTNMGKNMDFIKKLKGYEINKTQNIILHIDASTNEVRAQLLMSIVYTAFSSYDIHLKTSYSVYRNEYLLTHDGSLSPTFDNKIKYMEEIPYSNDRYVYDLTTENHHFAAGIGNIIVHNTFFKRYFLCPS